MKRKISGLLYEYTRGYPFLISKLCKMLDEEIAGSAGFPDKASAWSESGVEEAVKRLLSEKNTLFESLIGKVLNFPELKNMLFELLFQGRTIAYNALNPQTDQLRMFGFIREDIRISWTKRG